MAADFGPDSGRERPPADHPPYIGLDQGIAGQIARPVARRASGRATKIEGREARETSCNIMASGNRRRISLPTLGWRERRGSPASEGLCLRWHEWRLDRRLAARS